MMENRVLDIEGGINFRDMGGYQTADGQNVKWGQIYRSGQLNRISEKGLKDIQKLSITHVFDLRSQGENELFPSLTKQLPKVNTYEHPVYFEPSEILTSNPKMPQWNELMINSTPEQVKEHIKSYYPMKLYSHKGIYKKMLNTLAEDRSPLLFHCAAGKDRTGVGAAIILSLLGIDKDTIIEDYLITQRELSDKVEISMVGGAMSGEQFGDLHNHFGDTDPALLKPLFDADQSYIEELFQYIDETYGNFHNYVDKVLDFDQNKIDQLKENLLD